MQAHYSLCRYLSAVAFAGIFFLCSVSTTNAQVSISPIAVFMDDSSNFGSFTVLNNSDTEQEIAISFVFGYPDSDENGQSFINYEDSEAEEQYSINEWIRAFPRSFTLQPGSRQSVRATVRPPADLPDGTYWTRLKTTSNPLTPDIDESVEDGVQAQITFRFEQITPIFYKHGQVETGVTINDMRVNSNEGYVLLHAERSGNSPFLGSVRLSIYDDAGELVTQNTISTTVYLDANRRVPFDVSELASGNYTAEVSFIAQRSDIPASDLVSIEPQVERTQFSIP